MAKTPENNDQITFFGTENKPSDVDLTGFVNEEHYESAENISEDRTTRPKKTVSSRRKKVPENIPEQITLDAEVAPEHNVRPQTLVIDKDKRPEIEPRKIKTPFWKFDYRKSIILTFIVFVSEYIGRAFKSSFFAKMFTSFSGAGNKFSETYIYGRFSSTKALKKRGNIKKSFRRSATNASLPSFFTRLFTAFTKIKVRIYGLAFAAFAITSAIVHFFIHTNFPTFNQNVYTPITSIIVFVASIFLISCKQTLLDAVKEGFILSTLFFNFLGIKRPQFDENDEIYFSPSGACIIGVLLGALTLFIPAHLILSALLLIVYTYLVVKYPETGVISLIMILPFIHLTVLVYVTTIISLAYIFKILTGKRTPNFEFPDIFVALFLLLTFVSELITFGSQTTMFTYSAFILIYFLCVCTLYEKAWFDRAIIALIASTFVYSVYSIFASFFAEALGVVIDKPYNTDLGIADTTVFGSTSLLSLILLCGIFYMFASFFTTKSKSNKFAYILLICVSLVFLIREASLIIIAALIVGLILFLTLKSTKTFILLAALAIILPLLAIFNSGIYSEISTIIENEQYRLKIWNAVVNMFHTYGITGIGISPDAFSTIYSTYYVGNTVNMPHSHSLLLQITISLGFLGIILFAIIIFFLMQSSFSFGRNSVDKSSRSRLLCYAGMCAMLSLVISGIGEYIWYNPRMIIFFWLICGLTVCARRSSNDLSDIDKLMVEINANYNG